jgi:hypothetical protein
MGIPGRGYGGHVYVEIEEENRWQEEEKYDCR